MTWLTWRQHRNQAYFGAAALAAFAVLMAATGVQMASQYHAALVSCVASHTCATLESTLTLGSPPVIFLVILTMAVPVLFGVFWGAPLVARELETGTSRFAWMQSVTRRHWLAVKAGWILLAAAAWGGAVSALVTWWSSPLNALKHQNFRPGQFDIQGIVPVGYALFAVALGIMAGTLVRRTLPALAITLGAFAALRVLIAYFVRPHYLAPITTITSLTSRTGPTGSYWSLALGNVSPNGQMLASNGLSNYLGYSRASNTIPSVCRDLFGGQRPGRAAEKIASCLSAHGYRGFITYQPASRYWPVPEHRDRHLRHPRRRSHRRDGDRAEPPRCLAPPSALRKIRTSGAVPIAAQIWPLSLKRHAGSLRQTRLELKPPAWPNHQERTRRDR